MEEGNYNILRIKVANLLLNPTNYRFSPQTNQREAIEVMLKDQGEKLYKLAEDIVENGLNPSEDLMVTPIEDGNATQKLYKVLEGNRRITALKLLSIPENIEGEEFAKIKTRFLKLHKRYAKNPISSVMCVVFPNESDANIWIERKHALDQNGKGTEMWNTKMKQRFDEATKGEKSVVLQVLDLLRNSEEATIGDMLLLDNVNSTNLERLISDPYVRGKIGIEQTNKVLHSKRNRSEVVKCLLHIIRNISRPEFKVADIYTKADRKSYVDQLLTQLDLPVTQAEQEWKVDSTHSTEGDNSSTTNKSHNIKSSGINKIRTRSTLIPTSLELSIPNKYIRVSDIFRELRMLSARRYPNTVAVMFRVFLELSVNAYLETFGLLGEGQLTANDGKPNLVGHAQKVMNHMVTKKFINKDMAKGIKNELKTETSPLSIESLNAYVHSAHLFPQCSNLITGWDNVQPFFVTLWSRVNEELSNKSE